ncbi:MAG: hypothetical protein K2M75_01515 [Clostridia bacterium]|nr:hypothetical protein [Clostridia bacterium]
MKKKILISALVVVMIMSMTLVLFTGCKDKTNNELGTDFAIPTTKIGLDWQSNTDTEAVNADMSAFKMLEVGMRNYYNADYAIIDYKGGVNMNVGGFLPVDQEVQSTKIRLGKGDAEGKNANNAKYFADNKSYSNMANLYEKIIIDGQSVQYRNANKVKYQKADKRHPKDSWTVGSWNGIDTDFTSVANENEDKSLLKKKSNNPTILWMYDLKEENILKEIAPKYDAATKTYRFGFEFKPSESTVEYVKTMKAQLEDNAGMGVDGLVFQKLILKVVLWENGTIRSISVVETYKMTMVVSVKPKIELKGNIVTLTANQYFSYNPNEEGFGIDAHIATFTDNNHLKK